jgi:hypothetical protein
MRWPRPAPAASRRFSAGLGEVAGVVSQIARATDEQQGAAKSVTSAVAMTTEQARLVVTATAEQATSAAGIAQATVQMRKTAQEVAKAVAQQTTASRDILKASQNSGRLSAQVHKAASEQSKSAVEIVKSTESMRRGAASTNARPRRAAAASEQVAKATDGLTKMICRSHPRHGGTGDGRGAGDDRSGEHAQGVRSGGARHDRPGPGPEGDRRRHDQHGEEQIRLLSGANTEHSGGATRVLTQLKSIRAVSERNTQECATDTRIHWRAREPGRSASRGARDENPVARAATAPTATHERARGRS